MARSSGCCFTTVFFIAVFYRIARRDRSCGGSVTGSCSGPVGGGSGMGGGSGSGRGIGSFG
ncbi:hypothetical protein PL696_002961, partial [Pectobacterium atrosepticum]|uniref:hypothetical protein n=1 Tax=Pectobacterium atrosepticum TaxID=29471 RepID=UPI00254D6B3F